MLTHAHIDHSGYLPVLARDRWHGDVVCTAVTADLCRTLLPDSGHLQEKDSQHTNTHGFSKHTPAEPRYAQADAKRSLEQLAPTAFHMDQPIAGGAATLRFHPAGHILVAASATIQWGDRRIVFSGDLGCFDDPVLPSLESIEAADYLVVESTYGNRKHEAIDAASLLGDVIERTVGRGGSVVIPAFALGRVQMLLYHLSKLRAAGRLRDVPVFLDSPMAVDASELVCEHSDGHKLSRAECKVARGVATYISDVQASKALNADRGSKVILSASGMSTDGRVLHHPKHYAPDPSKTVLLAGFLAAGTRRATISSGGAQ